MKADVGQRILSLLILGALMAVPAWAEPHDGTGGTGRPPALNPEQQKKLINMISACMLGQGLPGGAAPSSSWTPPATTGGGDSGTGSVEKPTYGDSAATGKNSFDLVSAFLQKCSKCHNAQVTGSTLEDLTVTFGASDPKGVAPGRKQAANLINVIKNKSPMKGLYAALVTSGNTGTVDALEEWSKTSK